MQLLAPAVAEKLPLAQGIAGAEPPGQAEPIGHWTVSRGEMVPAGQKVPGAAVQAPEQVGVERPDVFPK